jgi:hypothetical protein
MWVKLKGSVGYKVNKFFVRQSREGNNRGHLCLKPLSCIVR